jgi:DME family drug/metabolite transporter
VRLGPRSADGFPGVGAIALSVLSQRPAGNAARIHLRALVLVGIGMAVYQASFFVAVNMAGVSLATLVALGLSPVLVTVLSVLVLKQTMDGRVLLSLLVALAGLCLLVAIRAPPPRTRLRAPPWRACRPRDSPA